ncbi:copper chaperone PCu(A)C [Sinirhodobacter populi]|uniref:Copper chaperone PCu(A)C n=1 Tax=Paenirhodobacter populi TaxID=2306993 RepID=A0A443K837_9RHOB|nr:copper chaperone PCu(A)C [Sinirhodobacter populi]RWR28947.1 copper chaperone PCu(A)C [Sinirhodobacter populi]
MKTVLLCAALCAPGCVMAQDLRISDACIRAPMPGAPVVSGYLTITNPGPVADRLTGGRADFADVVQVHGMTMDGEVMRMRQRVDGLPVPAGETVTLQPGGDHLMFTGLNFAPKSGDTLQVTLTFDHAGPVTLPMPVCAGGPAGRVQ